MDLRQLPACPRTGTGISVILRVYVDQGIKLYIRRKVDNMNSPLVLDGKALAKSVEQELAERVQRIKEKTGVTPILATILVGNDPASVTYVRMKGNACRRIGMESLKVELPEETTT